MKVCFLDIVVITFSFTIIMAINFIYQLDLMFPKSSSLFCLYHILLLSRATPVYNIFCLIWNGFSSTSNICSTKPICHHILWVYRVLLKYFFLSCCTFVVINKRFKIDNKPMYFFVFLFLFLFCFVLFLFVLFCFVFVWFCFCFCLCFLLFLFFNGQWYTETDVLCFSLKKSHHVRNTLILIKSSPVLILWKVWRKRKYYIG